MSYFLAFVGFAVLIVLHELGHFTAAKAVGMHVERFSLFFPPHIVKVRRGETDYCVGAIPLGGYVKIAGMAFSGAPTEEVEGRGATTAGAPPAPTDERGYFAQPVWKRIVVIAAGPAVNVLVAFLLLWGVFFSQGATATDRHGKAIATTTIAPQGLRPPASALLRPGDQIVAIDGHRVASPATVRSLISAHRCAGVATQGCAATTPVRIVVRRGGRPLTFSLPPRYDTASAGTRLGFVFDVLHRSVGVGDAADLSATEMWRITRLTAGAIVRIFEPKQRKQLSGIVGIYTVTQQAFSFDVPTALELLGLISLSLALINLFPFLPLDGGHIFWAVAEKVRGRRIPFHVMERSMAVGFVLVMFLFVIGLSNDIGRLTGSGFHAR